MLAQNVLSFLKILLVLIGFVPNGLVIASSNAEVWQRAFQDQRPNVYGISRSGRIVQISNKGNATSLRLAPDNKTHAWLVMHEWAADGDDKPGSDELVIYRNGEAVSLRCGPFIRDYWFWRNGDQVAIECGGKRFAGREILYDTKTMKELESFDQAKVPVNERPDWSSGSGE